MTPDLRPEVTALALNVAIPPSLQWTDTRRGEEFTLTSITVRMLPDGHLAAKAYGRPTNGGKGTYVRSSTILLPCLRSSNPRR